MAGKKKGRIVPSKAKDYAEALNEALSKTKAKGYVTAAKQKQNKNQ